MEEGIGIMKLEMGAFSGILGVGYCNGETCGFFGRNVFLAPSPLARVFSPLFCLRELV